MGSEWSCPCGARERLRRRISTSQEVTERDNRFSNISINIKSLSGSKVEKRLKQPIGEYILSSISKHPVYDKCLLISKQEKDLEFKRSPEGSFKIFSHDFESPEALATEIKKKYENGLSFIGGFCEKKNFLCLNCFLS